MARVCSRMRATAISADCARKSPRREERPRRRCARWMPPIYGGSLQARSGPRLAAVASWPRSSAPNADTTVWNTHERDHLYRRDAAVTRVVRRAGATAAAVGARRFPQPHLPGDRADDESADPAAAPHPEIGRASCRERLSTSVV